MSEGWNADKQGGHVEDWLQGARLWLRLQDGQGELALIPVEENAAGRPMHNRDRMVTTPIDLERLRQLHETIGALLAWTGVPAETGHLRVLILPDGRKRVMVLPNSPQPPAPAA
jgi:hypothetical protein